MDFQAFAGFPGVIGAIDCTHIRIPCPDVNLGLNFVNRRGYYSLNCQVVSSVSQQIVSIVAHHLGSTHDSRIFNESRLCQRLQQGHLHGHLLGDGGYGCRSYLLTPLRTPNTEAERRYQRAHIPTRQVVERLFGMWKNDSHASSTHYG